MNYKIIRVSSQNYQGIYNLFDKKKIKNLDYDDFYNHYFDKQIGYSNSFSREMNNYGNQSHEIIINDYLFQTKWAKKYSPKLFESKNKDFLKEVFFKQIEYYKPDVLFFQNKSPLKLKEINELKQINKSLKIIAIHNGIMLNNEEASIPDLIFAATPDLHLDYKSRNLNSELCYHYFDHKIINKINLNNKIFDLTFCGITGCKGSPHRTRNDYIDFLKKNTNIKVKGNRRIKEKNILHKYLKKIFPNYRKQLFGLSYYDFLSKSYISFNSHTDLSKNSCGNLRMFEVTGVGSCLLTDYKKNLNDIFEKDFEVVSYKSKEDCLDKIKFLLNNKKKITEISLNGQKRTLKDHNAKIRIGQINDKILKFL